MSGIKTTQGYFAQRGDADGQSMIDFNYMNYVDIDDDTRFDLATFVMAKGQSKSTGTPEFFGWAGEMTDRTGSVSATTTLATNATQLYAQSTANIRVGDILHFPTAGEDGDHVRVTAVAAPLNISDLNTRTAAIATAATFIVLGEAAAFDSSTSVAATYSEPAKVTNYTQLIRRAVAWDETEMATSQEVKASRVEQKTSWMRKEFRKDLGFTFWFGRGTQDTSNNFQTTKGVIVQIAAVSAAINAGGALVAADFSDLAEALALYSDNSRYECFHGTKAIGGLADLGTTARVGAQDRTGAYGYAGQEVTMSDFNFRLRFDRILEEAGTPYDGYLVALDMSNIWCYHMNNYKFKYQKDAIDDKGGEIVKHQMKANVGIACTWPKRHGYIRGIT